MDAKKNQLAFKIIFYRVCLCIRLHLLDKPIVLSLCPKGNKNQ